jgi:hypothetical protein
MAAPHDISTFAVNFIGDPADDAATMEALTNAGPMLIAQDHMLSTMVPGALDHDSNAPHVTIMMTELAGATYGGLIFGASMRGNCMHFALRKTRWAKLFADVRASGIDMTPIPGGAVAAIPVLTERLTSAIKRLPDHLRTITAADVMYDGAADNPGTDEWYDFMTPTILMGNEAGSEIVAQFAQMTPGCWRSEGAGGRDQDAFTHIMEGMLAALGRDVSNIPGHSIAAAVGRWMRKTRPPAPYIPYVDPAAVQI